MSATPPPRTRSISGRIAEDDFDFLMAYQIDGQVTASEKLRHIASFFRRYHDGMTDYAQALAEMQRLTEPTRLALKRIERDERMRSTVLDQTLQALPEMIAQITAAVPELTVDEPGPRRQAANDLESHLCEGLLHLLESTLRMAVTSKSPTYAPRLLQGRLDTIVELVALLRRPDSAA